MIKQSELNQFKINLDINSFLEYYKTHTDKEVIAKYDISKNYIKQILKYYNIKLTNEEKHFRFILNCPDVYGMPYDEYKLQVQTKRNTTNVEKYGEDYQEIFQKNQQQTMLDKYGVENPSQVAEFRDKVKQTNLEKYGSECNLSTSQTKEKIKQTCIEKYGTEYACQSQEVKNKIIKSNVEKYGVENVFQNDDIKEKSKQTCQDKYGVDYASQSEEFRRKVVTTCLTKYGATTPSKSQEVKDKIKQTNLKKYGVRCTLLSPEIKLKIDKINLDKYGTTTPVTVSSVRHKIAQSSNLTSLEKRMMEFLSNNDFEFVHHYLITVNNLSHDFDFAIFHYTELKALIDCDGLYYHGYISDTNGKSVNSYTDEYREQLVPENVIFLCCVENNEEECYQDILKLKNISYNDYVMEIFNWCRQYEFPYPQYDDKILIKSYENLCKYLPNNFSMNSRPGMKVIEQFHKSIWKANKYNKISPYDAWTNDELLLKSIKNRLIYKGCNLYPSKVLGGFIHSQIAPKVSVFNPYLAKYLTNKYLNQYNTVFDPCSGYSGRMLGVCSLGKRYIGQDINKLTVEESKEIINYLNLNAKVSQKDLFEDSGKYDCILTCTPYSNKEQWGTDIKKLSCDEWVDEILQRYDCNTYVFVVDETIKYKNHISEELINKSHFGTSKEYVLTFFK